MRVFFFFFFNKSFYVFMRNLCFELFVNIFNFKIQNSNKHNKGLKYTLSYISLICYACVNGIDKFLYHMQYRQHEPDWGWIAYRGWLTTPRGKMWMVEMTPKWPKRWLGHSQMAGLGVAVANPIFLSPDFGL
jgi:hypothetical protein